MGLTRRYLTCIRKRVSYYFLALPRWEQTKAVRFTASGPHLTVSPQIRRLTLHNGTFPPTLHLLSFYIFFTILLYRASSYLAFVFLLACCLESQCAQFVLRNFHSFFNSPQIRFCHNMAVIFFFVLFTTTITVCIDLMLIFYLPILTFLVAETQT